MTTVLKCLECTKKKKINETHVACQRKEFTLMVRIERNPFLKHEIPVVSCPDE